jgi:nucleoid DNA-binding protein
MPVALLKIIKTSLEVGEEVKVSGFGKFKVLNKRQDAYAH